MLTIVVQDAREGDRILGTGLTVASGTFVDRASRLVGVDGWRLTFTNGSAITYTYNHQITVLRP